MNTRTVRRSLLVALLVSIRFGSPDACGSSEIRWTPPGGISGFPRLCPRGASSGASRSSRHPRHQHPPSRTQCHISSAPWNANAPPGDVARQCLGGLRRVNPCFDSLFGGADLLGDSTRHSAPVWHFAPVTSRWKPEKSPVASAASVVGQIKKVTRPLTASLCEGATTAKLSIRAPLLFPEVLLVGTAR